MWVLNKTKYCRNQFYLALIEWLQQPVQNKGGERWRRSESGIDRGERVAWEVEALQLSQPVHLNRDQIDHGDRDDEDDNDDAHQSMR